MNLRLLFFFVCASQSYLVAGAQDRFVGDKLTQPNYSPLFASSDIRDVIRLLTRFGKLSEAWQHCKSQLAAHPGDFNLRNVAFEVAFLREDYDSLRWAHTMPKDVLRDYPELTQTFSRGGGWQTVASYYVAHLNGVKTGRDPEALESEVLKEAWAKRESLPFGMVDEDGVHVDKQVLTLLLLRDSFGGSHRKLLFDRAAKLAPNDSFILEMKAKLLLDDGEEAKAVEMYKKALKAKASDARIKYLKKELIEAEKKAEWRTVVGPRTDRKGGG